MKNRRKTMFISDNGVQYILRAMTIAPFRQLADEEVHECQRVVWKHSDGCTVRRFQELSTGGEACFGFEVHVVNQASIVERIRYRLREFATAALGYIGISAVVVKIVL